MTDESLIILPRAYQEGAILGHRPSAYDATKVIPIEIPFTRNSVAMRRNSAGLWESVANNVPRLHYPVGGGCPSWLLEPQRTNIILRSQWLNTSPWTLADISVVENSITAPDGTFTGNKITLNSGAVNALERASQSMTIAAGLTYTFSVWVKAGDYTGSMLLRGDVTTNTASIGYNFTTGVVTSTGSNVVSATKVVDSDGWVRLILVFTTVLNPQVDVLVFNGQQATKFYYCWGVQLEAGAYATSYIPTTTAAVTRVAELISKTGASEIIGQTEGTIFVDVVINSENNPFANIINGAKNTNSSFSIVRVKATKAIRASVYNSAIIKADISGGSYNLGDRLKIAYGYKSGDSVLFVNGVQIGTSADAISFPATLSELNWDDATTYFGYQESENINETIISKTRLPNAELAALTTI